MRRDREKALVQRLRGHSYTEINRLLGIPKSTLSGWFTGLVLPEKARQRIQSRVAKGSLRGLMRKNKKQTHEARQRAISIRRDAQDDIQKISGGELMLIGAALYWAEGYKRPIVKNGRERTYHTISLSNSDPIMIAVFIRFLKEILQIAESKIYANVRIFKHINENEALRYWQKITGIPKDNFRKFYYGVSKSSLGKRPYNRLPHGMIQVIVGDTNRFHQIMGWIEGIKQRLS